MFPFLPFLIGLLPHLTVAVSPLLFLSVPLDFYPFLTFAINSCPVMATLITILVTMFKKPTKISLEILRADGVLSVSIFGGLVPVSGDSSVTGNVLPAAVFSFPPFILLKGVVLHSPGNMFSLKIED